ncbi:MAG TPA: hypothetical protein VLX92_07520 [Kofleriaceae bacterium]|nr:hypothetical protein [Kofleriaceae bacterium]
MLRLAVVAMVVALAAPAYAGDAARIKQVRAMFDAQIAAIAAHDEAAFAKTVTPDARILFDVSAADMHRGGVPDGAQTELMYLRGVKVGASEIGWDGTWGWIAAELHVTTQMYAEPEGAGDPHPQLEPHVVHWVALVTLDGAAIKTRAAMIVETVPDRELRATNQDRRRKPAASPGAIVALLANPPALAAQLSRDPATTIFGSSEDDRGLGAAAAGKLVERWKKLRLAVLDAPTEYTGLGPLEVIDGDHAFGFAELFLTLGKDPVIVTGFVIAKKAGDAWQVVAASYAGGT